jgi:hypothetical protein
MFTSPNRLSVSLRSGYSIGVVLPTLLFSYSKSCSNHVITTMEELHDRVGSVRWW